jgi:hypothetical protein
MNAWIIIVGYLLCKSFFGHQKKEGSQDLCCAMKCEMCEIVKKIFLSDWVGKSFPSERTAEEEARDAWKSSRKQCTIKAFKRSNV